MELGRVRSVPSQAREPCHQSSRLRKQQLSVCSSQVSLLLDIGWEPQVGTLICVSGCLSHQGSAGQVGRPGSLGHQGLAVSINTRAAHRQVDPGPQGASQSVACVCVRVGGAEEVKICT